MDKFNAMSTFVEVVQSGSFTAAAERLHLSRAQVSKSIMQLEAHLDSRLLNRTTRKISLTEMGKIYYERCLAILRDVEEVEGIASQQHAIPSGRLKLGVPTSFGLLHLNALLPEYLKQHPQVEIDLSLSDRFIDVVDEGYDLVIRIAELEDSSLIARRLAPCKRIYCAAPEYLRKKGTPTEPADLIHHQCLVYTNENRPEHWQIAGPEGSQTIRVKGPICADNGDTLKAAAVAGMGIALLPTFIAGSDLAKGRLTQVLADFCPPEISIYAVFPSHRYLSAKVRTFVDILTQQFGEQPTWDQLANQQEPPLDR